MDEKILYVLEQMNFTVMHNIEDRITVLVGTLPDHEKPFVFYGYAKDSELYDQEEAEEIAFLDLQDTLARAIENKELENFL